MKMNVTKENFRSAVLGVLVGDALGLPVQFAGRETRDADPVTGMRGFGVFRMPEGSWSDDGSMTLASLDSLVGGFDPEDMMQCFLDWMDEGAYTQYGFAYDMGGSTMNAIDRFRDGTPAEECGDRGVRSNGNGSLMRAVPMSLDALCHNDLPDALCLAHRASALTHAHPIAMVGCGLYTAALAGLLDCSEDAPVLRIGRKLDEAFSLYDAGLDGIPAEALKPYARLRDLTAFTALPRDEIRSTGYVADTLEAALWSFLSTRTLKDALLTAVNLGDDTDSVAAVTGGLAGLGYGAEAIPTEWLTVMQKLDMAESLIEQFASFRLEG